MKKEKNNKTKRIYLGHNRFAIIDEEDLKKVSKYTWYSCKRNKIYYAYTHPKKKDNPISMHRFIINPPKNKIIDHKDGDGLNNRKNNLRICNHSQNKINLINYNNNTSGFRGIIWDKERKKWAARIKVNGKLLNLGRYNLKEEAINTRHNKSIELFGDFTPSTIKSNKEVQK